MAETTAASEPKRSWGDLAEEEEEEAAAKSKSTQEEAVEGEVSKVVEKLSIKDDDSNIQAVKSKSTQEEAVEGEVSKVVEKLSIKDDDDTTPTLDEPDDSNIQAVTAGDTPYTSAVTFEDLNLSPELIKGVYVEMKFQKPSKIQAISLPMILTPPFKDLIAQAHNGSGKTTCFVLGMLCRVDPNLKRPQALCICPTRELSIQNDEVLRKMAKYTGITSSLAVPINSPGDSRSRSQPPIMDQVVIGTPGTVKRLMSQRKLSVSGIKVLVFDEADHMLAKDGFQDDSLRIMKDIEKVNRNCQVLLFSATFNEVVKDFVSKVVKKEHNQLFVKKEELSLDAVKQYKVYCPDELAKILVIKDKILEFGERLGQSIIFVRTKRSAGSLHEALVNLGYEVTTIHGALTPEDRDKIVKEFKDGLTHVLITTDLLSRGFDQQKVNLVVNFDLPVKYGDWTEPDYELYLHRIGRAGRFGRKGAVFNFLMTEDDKMIMEKIEKYFGHPVTEVPSWESEEDFQAALRAADLL